MNAGMNWISEGDITQNQAVILTDLLRTKPPGNINSSEADILTSKVTCPPPNQDRRERSGTGGGGGGRSAAVINH